MFHIITPMARYENIPKLIDILKTQGVIWHVITDDDNPTPIHFTETWIHHSVCPNKNVEFWARCNYSINWFIDDHILSPEDYYCVLNDDDGYEQDFFLHLKREIQQAVHQNKDVDLVITSMKRGHHIPEGLPLVKQHPTNTLFAQPENMRVCGVGVEQFFLKGKFLKQHRLPLTPCGDGELITELVRLYPTLYLPNLFVLFNYLEPRRWDPLVPACHELYESKDYIHYFRTDGINLPIVRNT